MGKKVGKIVTPPAVSVPDSMSAISVKEEAGEKKEPTRETTFTAGEKVETYPAFGDIPTVQPKVLKVRLPENKPQIANPTVGQTLAGWTKNVTGLADDQSSFSILPVVPCKIPIPGKTHNVWGLYDYQSDELYPVTLFESAARLAALLLTECLVAVESPDQKTISVLRFYAMNWHLKIISNSGKRILPSYGEEDVETEEDVRGEVAARMDQLLMENPLVPTRTVLPSMVGLFHARTVQCSWERAFSSQRLFRVMGALMAAGIGDPTKVCPLRLGPGHGLCGKCKYLKFNAPPVGLYGGVQAVRMSCGKLDRRRRVILKITGEKERGWHGLTCKFEPDDVENVEIVREKKNA